MEQSPRRQEHRLERLARLLAERMEYKAELLANAMLVEGRYAFTENYTEYEQWQQFQDLPMRIQTEEKILATDGPKGLEKYLKHMAEVGQRAAEAGLTPEVPQEGM